MIILKRPIITEKSMRLAKDGQYSFEVDKNATKSLVAKIVSEKFNVKVLNVKIINTKGVTKNIRTGRGTYKTSGMKKAIVKVKRGEKIAIFETPKEEQEVTVRTAEGEPIKMKEKKDLLGRIKVRVEKSSVGAAPTTQRKVIPT